MREEVELIKYRSCDIKIYQDEDYRSPGEWENNNVFLVNYHRDFEVKNDKVITKEDVINWYHAEKIPQQKDYYIFALSMLSHSGVWLSLEHGFISDAGGWDTSHVGVVLVSKKEVKSKKKAVSMAQSLVNDWNDCLSGNVYGYIAEKEGVHIGSCWGFYGDHNKNGMISEAKSEIDNWIKEEMKKRAKKVKAYVNNRVPLDKRQPSFV